jgi:2'-aminobiphenyl-2,3-diol 1,2-dioxygenase small subunit
MAAPAGVHAMIHHLIATPGDRGLIKTDPARLFDRFGDPNLIIKWLIWSGRATITPFPISYYFDRR